MIMSNSKVGLNQQYFELPDQFGMGSGIVGTFSLTSPQYNQQPASTYQPSDFNSDASDVDGEMYHTQGVYVQDELNYRRWKILLSLREEFYKGEEEDSAVIVKRKCIPAKDRNCLCPDQKYEPLCYL